MSRIQAILAQGRSFKDEEAERPSLDDIVAAERRLGVDFPQDYREFLWFG
ncbi:MAG: SMI1/KNR4 family protein [Acidobacteriota bacterium]